MSTLSREARAIVAAAKGELLANDDDRLRITILLRNRMGATGFALAAPTQAAPFWAAVKSLRFMTVVGTLGVVGALSSINYLGKSEDRARAQTNHLVVAQTTPAREPFQTEPSSAVAQPPEPPIAASPGASSPKVEPISRTLRTLRDSLGEEVQILSRAEKELHNGRPALALMALDEHQRRFASGALAQERAAARVQALCALGRTEDAKAELLKLKRNAPHSPQAAHAASPCESLR